MDGGWLDEGMFVISINGIKNKILIFALLATLIPSVGLGLLSFWHSETMIADNVMHQLRTLVEDTRRELEYWLKERRDGVRALADADAVINGLLAATGSTSSNAGTGEQVLPQYLRLVQERLDAFLVLTVVDAAGQVVASSGEDSTPVQLPEVWSQDASAIDRQVLQRLRTQDDAPLHYEGHMHAEVLGLAASPETFPVMIVAERDRAEVYREWMLFRNLFLALVGGLALLVGMIGWLFGRSIVTPLRRLTRAAERIAAGKLDVELAVARRDEVGQLTQVFNQMAGKLRDSHEKIEAASLALRQQNRQLEKLSITDNLTGLYNRNKLDEILSEQLRRFRRSQKPFSLLMLDIDHFKQLNDTHGHLAGDQVLVGVAKTLAESIRSVDYAARYGGEEFIIVLPETNMSTARELAERICTRVRDSLYPYRDQALAVTLSIGVADIRSSDDDADAIIARADRVMYEAKEAGRNRVCCVA
ncbi:MAG: diguanylate cyclase [Xanthomonadaceae bacterium]|nr:diguanylate cyclase [Xanthomonadaceae bacterium]